MTQLTEYFVGGHLDGQRRDFDKTLPPQIAAVDEVHGVIDIYVRQPIFDDQQTRHWVAVESPEELLNMREFKQSHHTSRKVMTVGELRAAVMTLDAMGFPDDAPLRGKISWTGHLTEMSASRDDKA